MRRAFTLVEALVATVAASIILVLLYGSLVFYSKAYTRGDEELERGRRGQEMLGLFRDDAERAEGEIQPSMVPADGLKAIGWQSDATALLTNPHRAVNVINCYTNLIAQKPYLSKRFELQEVWKRDPGGTISRDDKASRYTQEQPPARVRELIPPMTANACVVRIPVPWDNPKSEYLAVRKVVNTVPTMVLWAFHREKNEKWPAGTVVRWTEATGAKSVGGEQVVAFAPDIFYDWAYADPAPPRRPDPYAQTYKMQAGLSVAFGGSKVRDKDPGFSMEAVFLIGP